MELQDAVGEENNTHPRDYDEEKWPKHVAKGKRCGVPAKPDRGGGKVSCVSLVRVLAPQSNVYSGGKRILIYVQGASLWASGKQHAKD
jgi:hypothetical protein